jgi:glycosyltransferase involved in cell wall biosynthesis
VPTKDNSIPLVTIITPSYNRGGFVEQTIRSVLSQDYPRIEYIVLDDGSTDDTRELLDRYAGKISWVSHPNMGETRTVNKGFQMASGDIICVVNSDDPLLPGAVSAAVEAFRGHPAALVVYSDWLEIGPQSEPIHEYKLPHYDIHNMLEDFNVAMGPGTFFRRRAFDLIGLRDVTLRFTGDLDYWFRLALHGPFVHIPRTFATHRSHPEAASSSLKSAQMAGELVRLALKVCSDKKLPDDLRRARWKILANAHFVAARYCGSDRAARRAHEVKWLLFGGWVFPIRRWATRGLALRPRLSRVTRIFFAFIHLMGMVAAALWLFLISRVRMKRQSRFLLISHVLPPSWSGQAVILGRLLKGVDPSLYCVASINRYDESSVDHSERLPSRYHVLGREVLFPGSSRYAWIDRANTHYKVLQRGLAIGHIIHKEQCSSVVVCTGDLIDPPAASLAARLTGAFFYLYVFDDYIFQWLDPVVQNQARSFERRMIQTSTGIIVPNEFMAKEIRRRHKRDARIVRNACAWFPRRERVRHDTGEDARHRKGMLVYTGAVYHVNSNTFRVIIAALKRIQMPGIRLHVYTAQSEEYLRYQGVFGPHIVYHPHAPYAEIERVQRQADILVIPFDFNSPAQEVIRTAAPGKFGDYLASGAPILAVVPGNTFVAWYLRHHDCGIVVDQEDSDAVADAILRLLSDAELRGRLVANATARASEDFDSGRAQHSLLRALGVVH